MLINLLLQSAIELWQDNKERRDKYEAALRRELATMRARKRCVTDKYNELLTEQFNERLKEVWGE